MPAFAHACTHATGGMHNFPDGMRNLAVWSTEKERAAARTSPQKGWAAAAALCREWGNSGRRPGRGYVYGDRDCGWGCVQGGRVVAQASSTAFEGFAEAGTTMAKGLAEAASTVVEGVHVYGGQGQTGRGHSQGRDHRPQRNEVVAEAASKAGTKVVNARAACTLHPCRENTTGASMRTCRETNTSSR